MSGPARRSTSASRHPRSAPDGRTGRPARPRPRRPAAGGVAEPPAPGRPAFTGRATVLALALCAVVLTLAYPLRQYLAQRAEIDQLRDQTAAQQQRVDDLEAAKRRWDDPAYVKAQARERLHYVMPGETGYVVVDPEPEPTPEMADGEPARPADGADSSWLTRMWDSVEQASEAPAGSAP